MHNVLVLWVDVAAFMGGLALFDSVTIIPVLLARLGAPEPVIGLARFIQVLGASLPALIAAHAIHGRQYHKRFLVWTAALSRCGAILIAPVLWYSSHLPRTFVIAWVIGCITLFWMMDGLCSVSWFDIIGKCIPARIRGRFFGVMQTLSGIVGVSAGAVVIWALSPSGPRYPYSYAWLAIGWAVFSSLSVFLLMAIHETPSSVAADEEMKGWGEYFRYALPLFRANKRLRGLVISRILADGVSISTPFYVVYAERKLGAPPSLIGAYVVALGVGRIVAGPVFGWVGDRLKPESSYRLACTTAMLAPALALVAGEQPLALYVTFFCVGAAQDGVWTTYSNVLLRTTNDEQRPLATGVSTMLLMPTAVYSVVGGMVIAETGYMPAFAVALGLGIIGLWCSTRLISVANPL